MTGKVKEKMVSWLSGFSESVHPLDTHRLYDFVQEACVHGERIYDDDLAAVLKVIKPDWNDSRIADFINDKMALIEHLQDFYSFCFDDLPGREKTHVQTVSNIDEFISEGDFNYHELYELAQAVSGYSEALNVFTSKDSDGVRRIEYVVTDIVYSFPISQAAHILCHIEKKYMDNLDPDTWYGFQYAMERAEDE